VSATASITAPVFDEVREHPGFNCRLGRQVGSEKLSMSLWEILLEGAPSLRTPAGWREMEEGEVVSFLDDGAGYFDFEREDAQ
jgi:hypothetical protein